MEWGDFCFLYSLLLSPASMLYFFSPLILSPSSCLFARVALFSHPSDFFPSPLFECYFPSSLPPTNYTRVLQRISQWSAVWISRFLKIFTNFGNPLVLNNFFYAGFWKIDVFSGKFLNFWMDFWNRPLQMLPKFLQFAHFWSFSVSSRLSNLLAKFWRQFLNSKYSMVFEAFWNSPVFFTFRSFFIAPKID